MGETLGQVVSVNAGRARTVEWHGRSVTSGIWKAPVDGPVEVGDQQLAGDEQADLRVHGGVDKAIYAYSVENYGWWAASMPDTSFGPGLFGENLTTEGVGLEAAVIGERWAIGAAVLEVSQPRFPCANLGMRMGDSTFTDRFDQARRNGTYLRVVQPGTLQAGDPIVRVALPDHGIRIADLVATKLNDAPAPLLHRILSLDTLPPDMHHLATRTLTNLEAK